MPDINEKAHKIVKSCLDKRKEDKEIEKDLQPLIDDMKKKTVRQLADEAIRPLKGDEEKN